MCISIRICVAFLALKEPFERNSQARLSGIQIAVRNKQLQPFSDNDIVGSEGLTCVCLLGQRCFSTYSANHGRFLIGSPNRPAGFVRMRPERALRPHARGARPARRGSRRGRARRRPPRPRPSSPPPTPMAWRRVARGAVVLRFFPSVWCFGLVSSLPAGGVLQLLRGGPCGHGRQGRIAPGSGRQVLTGCAIVGALRGVKIC